MPILRMKTVRCTDLSLVTQPATDRRGTGMRAADDASRASAGNYCSIVLFVRGCQVQGLEWPSESVSLECQGQKPHF